MAERRLSAPDKGKAKVGEPSREDKDFLSDDDQNIQENQHDVDPDHMFSPFKKQRTDDDDEGPAPVVDDETPQVAEHVNIPHENPINIPAINPLDQIQGSVPGQPGSRDLSAEPIFISKILTSSEADPTKARLYIDRDKARIMADDPDFDLVYPPIHWFTKTILVFDSDDRPYLMDLSRCTKGGRIKYAFEGIGWEGFLLLHGLKGGDNITIYRILDRNVSDEYYYVLKFVRKIPESTKVERPADDGQEDPKGWLRIGL